MRTIIETLAAGVPSVYNIAGSHLEILSAEFPVSVSIQDANGVETTNGKSENILAGTYFVPQKGFDRFTITSATAQQVMIGVSFGESGTRRVAGTVTIAGTPNVTIANPDAQKKYFTYGSSFKSNAPLAANTPETIFTAAANVNGAILHRAGFSGYKTSGNLTGIVFIAKTAVPASVIDGDVVIQVDTVAAYSGFFISQGAIDQPVFIPPGKGLFAISTSAELEGLRSALYTLL